MNYASIGKRILAAIIDGFVIWALSFATILFAGIFGVILSSFVVTGAYHILMMGSSWHATLGQRALNIQVVDEYGNGIDYGKATGRFFASVLSEFILCIGYLIGLFDSSYQTLHDKLAGTYVVEACPVPAARGGVGGSTGGSIIGVSGEKAGMKFPLYGNGLMIGRDPSVCHIIMHNAQGISRIHCFVSYNPNSRMYIISDRNSTYGTFTDKGERITPQKSVALKSGERFYLGNRNNTFEVG